MPTSWFLEAAMPLHGLASSQLPFVLFLFFNYNFVKWRQKAATSQMIISVHAACENIWISMATHSTLTNFFPCKPLTFVFTSLDKTSTDPFLATSLLRKVRWPSWETGTLPLGPLCRIQLQKLQSLPEKVNATRLLYWHDLGPPSLCDWGWDIVRWLAPSLGSEASELSSSPWFCPPSGWALSQWVSWLFGAQIPRPVLLTGWICPHAQWGPTTQSLMSKEIGN